MHREGEEVHIDKDEARAGSTPHIVRWVLVASLSILVILFTLTFVVGVDQASDGRESANVTDDVAQPDAS
jgi:hypothetical protein